jgi:hypothetical protein
MPAVTKREIVAFSEIDSERFGVRIARAPNVSDNLSRVLDFCAAEQIDLLIARCATSDLGAAQSMESNGFLLMDTLVYYSFDLTKKEIPEDPCEVRVRRLQPGDEAEIPRVASPHSKATWGTIMLIVDWIRANVTRRTVRGLNGRALSRRLRMKSLSRRSEAK